MAIPDRASPSFSHSAGHLSRDHLTGLSRSFPFWFNSFSYYAFVAAPFAVFSVLNPVAAPEWLFLISLIFGLFSLVIFLVKSIALWTAMRRYRAENIGFNDAARRMAKAARRDFLAGQLAALALILGLSAAVALAFPGLAFLAGLLTLFFAGVSSILPGLAFVKRPADAGLALVLPPSAVLTDNENPKERFFIAWRFAGRMRAVRSAVADRNLSIPSEPRDFSKALDSGGLVRPPIQRLNRDPVGALWLRFSGLRAVLQPAAPVALIVWIVVALLPPDGFPALPRPSDLWPFTTPEEATTLDEEQENDKPEEQPEQSSGNDSSENGGGDNSSDESAPDPDQGGQGSESGSASENSASDGNNSSENGGNDNSAGESASEPDQGGQRAESGSASGNSEGSSGGEDARDESPSETPVSDMPGIPSPVGRKSNQGSGSEPDDSGSSDGSGARGDEKGSGTETGQNNEANSGSDSLGTQQSEAGAKPTGNGQGPGSGSGGGDKSDGETQQDADASSIDAQPSGSGPNDTGNGLGDQQAPANVGPSESGQGPNSSSAGAEGPEEASGTSGGDVGPGGEQELGTGPSDGSDAEGERAEGPNIDPSQRSQISEAGSGEESIEGLAPEGTQEVPFAQEQSQENGSDDEAVPTVGVGKGDQADEEVLIGSPPVEVGEEALEIEAQASLFAPAGSAPPTVTLDLSTEEPNVTATGPSVPPRQKLPAWIAELLK